jgi:hypothetical protein
MDNGNHIKKFLFNILIKYYIYNTLWKLKIHVKSNMKLLFNGGKILFYIISDRIGIHIYIKKIIIIFNNLLNNITYLSNLLVNLHSTFLKDSLKIIVRVKIYE